jgi:hypothetical protein
MTMSIEESLASRGIEPKFFGRPARNLVTILAELPGSPSVTVWKINPECCTELYCDLYKNW